MSPFPLLHLSVPGDHRLRRLAAVGIAAFALSISSLVAAPQTAQALAPLPCDIYASASSPCVAAYSSVRALYDTYNGSLYQVTRASDSTSLNVGVVSTGGYANAAAQNTFCSGTTCTITAIYDQWVCCTVR